MQCFRLVLLLVFVVLVKPVPSEKADIVISWARKLGRELWQLSEALTKSDQIRSKYTLMNASVKQKNGGQILESALKSVSTMLTRKMKAVKCIHKAAELLAQEFNYTMTENKFQDFQYCSAKYSRFQYEDMTDNSDIDTNIPKFAKNNSNYMDVQLEKDSHFYDISVNTNISCVHVPTNIYYQERGALNAILWSKGLNDIFIDNYRSDPSLAWQYFGSSHGILRFFPGMPWNNRRHVDTYDCRVQSWYIEAATCSKDVIILFDVSGSMTGFKNYVARRTLSALLKTLSNNDYVNVYTFKNETKLVVECFVGLVQATGENLKTITDTLEPTEGGKVHKKHPLEGNANLTEAYIKAFTTLKEKRKNCSVNSMQGCNQLVMVITDYVPGNLTEVFENYNREIVNNVTYTPVRVFTYLIGKEVTNVREIQWMACLNRGYFVHIHSIEEVQQQVLKYINVIARPMILADDEPPPTWTHASIDATRTIEWAVSSDVKKPDEDKLVTSVAIPAFDRKYNAEHNDAILLGVAGTDVPIDSIAKLAQPHQLGVNGYSFIVSNNGYLLLHPLLITTINNSLQVNYNSVDFVEVEQVDDGNGPRVLGEEITELRQKLVAGVNGSLTDIKVLFHYDGMRRIARVKHDYYFNNLNGTPFSMGISLPKGYGDTELELKDNPLEAKEGKELTGINVTDYFRFSYRVHPDWVYCKYHYLEGHESDNSEEEIWSFLVRVSNNEIDITKKQYKETDKTKFDFTRDCGKAAEQLQKDDYYCNDDLVKQLVFDAKLSTPFFKDWNATDEEIELAKKYNVSVRFIATASGMTRWNYIFDTDKNEEVDDQGNRSKNSTEEVFGDKYYNAIEETWYKAAVLQHMINKESIVIATPLPVLDKIIKQDMEYDKNGDIVMTASYAIFYKDGDSETPASVVGFEFSFLSFQKRFLEITNSSLPSDSNSNTNPFACGEDWDCFVVDSSGYVVMSLYKEDVGTFFGVVGKDRGLQNPQYVLASLLHKGVFEHVEVFNYQALCRPEELRQTVGSASWRLLTPFDVGVNIIRWLVAEFIVLLADFGSLSWDAYAAPQEAPPTLPNIDDYDLNSPGITDPPITTTTPVPPPIETEKEEKEEQKPFSCDHRISLYILNQTMFLDSMGEFIMVSEEEEGMVESGNTENGTKICYPAYYATYMRETNLLLVVMDANKLQFNATNCTIPPSTEPTPTMNSTTSREPCHKLDLAGLPRRRLEGCFTYHDGERNITACGMGNLIRVDLWLFATLLVAVTLAGRW